MNDITIIIFVNILLYQDLAYLIIDLIKQCNLHNEPTKSLWI